MTDINIFSELNTLLAEHAPVETGVFSGEAPDKYFVVTPLVDTYELYGDDGPEFEVQEARVSIYSKGSYLTLKYNVTVALLADGFSITERRYIGREDDTGYFHYALDVAKLYPLEEPEWLQ